MTSSAVRSSRVRLSVAMIVRDEAEVLSRSIESVRPIADEIVVLDTGSEDQTPTVAGQLGAVVSRGPWTCDFAAARNLCLQRTTGDWVLWLDAGECLVGETAAELRQFLDRQADPTKVYMLSVETPPAEADACCEQRFHVRLIPNDPRLYFTGRVRETLQPSIVAAGVQYDTAVGQVRLHPRWHDPRRQMLVAKRNLELASLEMTELTGAMPPRLVLARGEACHALGLWDEARRAFRQAANLARRGSTEMLEAYYGLLATYQTDEFLSEMRLTTCLEALEIFPFDAQLLMATGNYLLDKDSVDLAARSFEASVKFGQVDLETWHRADLAEVAADCLSLARQIQHKDEEACRVLEEALQRNAGSIRLQRRLMDLLIRHGRRDEALALAQRLPEPDVGHRPLSDAVRGACEAAGQRWTPALGYLQSAFVAGCRDPICLRWLSVTLLSNGQVESAGPVLDEWRRIEPADPELQSYLAALSQPSGDLRHGAHDDGTAPQHAERKLRVDQGTTSLQAMPPVSPIISQTTSSDLTSQI